jgi:hypothetical protein
MSSHLALYTARILDTNLARCELHFGVSLAKEKLNLTAES